MKRLGHRVTIIDPWTWLGPSKWVGRWLHHAGGVGIGSLINNKLFHFVAAVRPDLIWVNQGEFLDASLIRRLRNLDAPIINYTNDNPFSGRDGLRFRYYEQAIPHYDMLVVCFEENVTQAYKAGARQV